MKTKGIILAGGSGTRLHPITLGTCKQLLPIYDKPLVYYPLYTLRRAGIYDIMVITRPEDKSRFFNCLGDGSDFGCKLTYAEQAEPRGLADAFNVAGEYLYDTDVTVLALGDNILYGDVLTSLKDMLLTTFGCGGCHILAYPIKDPGRYGVVEIDRWNHAVSLEEKPAKPKSNLAVPGLYFFDRTVVTKTRYLTPSARGELEIVDLIKTYMESSQAVRVMPLADDTDWFDCGTFDSLLQAASFVGASTQRKGVSICDPRDCKERI